MTNDDATLTDLARRLNDDYRPGKRPGLPPAFFITDQAAMPDPVGVLRRLPEGFGVIFRDYDHPARAELGRILGAQCRERGLIFLVAAADLAAELSADGVHLPEGLMDRAPDIRKTHPGWMITAACHDRAAVCRAAQLSLDAGLAAPVFPTDSHPETHSGGRKTLGVSGLRALVAATDMPLYALGGVTRETAQGLRGVGVAGLAAIRGFAE